MIKFDQFEYQIDPDESELLAHITPSSSQIHWELEVSALDNPELDETDEAPYAAPRAYIFFMIKNLHDWRKLENSETSIHFEVDKDIHLTPQDPCGVWVGESQLALNHHIRIGVRSKNLFSVDWKFDAHDPLWENDPSPNVVHCSADLPFAGVRLSFPGEPQNLTVDSTFEEVTRSAEEWQPDMNHARQVVSKFFDLKDFEEPENTDWSLYYPLKGDIN